MRIAMVGPFGLGLKGTMRMRALPMAQALTARGHEVEIFLAPWGNPEDAGREEERGGVKIHNITLPPSIPLLGHLIITWRLLSQALISRPDIVHCFKVTPFFSCYLFVRVDPSNGLSSVRWTPGLRRIVSFGDQPAVVDERLISLIKERLAEIQESGRTGYQFQPGDRVVVTSGPLRDFEAIFDQKLSSQDRAKILVGLLGRWTRCQVDINCLKKAR